MIVYLMWFSNIAKKVVDCQEIISTVSYRDSRLLIGFNKNWWIKKLIFNK